MLTLTSWILATTIAMTPLAGSQLPKRIDVDCESDRALERALMRARWHREVDIRLHGVCRGHYEIARDGVTLRAATPGSGVAAPGEDSGSVPVLKIDNAKASLRGLIVRGGGIGVLVEGRDAEVLLYELDVHEQEGVGVIVTHGAGVRILDTTLRDGLTGILAETNSTINLQRVTVHTQRVGVIVFDKSFAAINDSTIENCSEAGLHVDQRSDANVLGGVFRENGQVHINANDWSSIRLLNELTIGSETDSTPHALGATRQATIASFSTPAIHGDVSSLVGSSIRMGNTVVHGDLTVIQFADAYVRNSEITGVVACVDGGEAICSQIATGGAFGCPSPTCGAEPPGAEGRAPALPEFPDIEAPRSESKSLTPSRPGASSARQ